jgi:RHS repeat-associated protein
LTAISQGATTSDFFYDGFGRRTEIIEVVNGSVVSNNYYLWCDTEICEQRDSTGANLTRRFFGQGEQSVTVPTQSSISNYYYTRDHLMSVREAVNTNGLLLSRYDYDPYGQQTVIQEAQKTTFAYTADFLHVPSKLYLTLYRPFDSATARWLSRDPIADKSGENLYQYVLGNPLNLLDHFGLISFDWNEFEINLLQEWAGFSDNFTIGVTASARKAWGTDAAPDRCSPAYRVGNLIGLGASLGNAASTLGRVGPKLWLLNVGKNGRFYGGRRGAWSFAQVSDWWSDVVKVDADAMFHDDIRNSIEGPSNCTCQ